MGTARWGGRKAVEAKAYCQRTYGSACWLCGRMIEDEKDYSVDHVIPRKDAPHLTWEPSNWRPAHLRSHPELGCPGNTGRRGAPAPTPAGGSRRW